MTPPFHPSSLAAGVLTVLIAVSGVSAQEQKPGEPLPSDHTHATVRPAKTFDEDWLRINDSLRSVEADLNDSSLADVSSEANAIAELAVQLGDMLLKKDSPIPRDRAKEISLAVRDVGAAAIDLHLTADEGKLPRARAVFARLRDAALALDALVPASYFCPMHCEAARTYGAPGTCPVCNMNLKKITTAKYAVTVVPAGRLAPGVECDLGFQIVDPTGAPVRVLETVHEKVLHLLMVSGDLSWYAHEHPMPMGDGRFELRIRFPHPGDYVLYHDFTPKDVGMQVVPVRLTVPGSEPAPTPLTPDAYLPKTVNGYTVVFDTGGPPATGSPAHLRYTISREGRPVTDLEPYLGALGHLIVISQNLRGFVHSHPKEVASGASSAHHGPSVEFEAWFDRPGRYKSWAQFQHAGAVLTVPFTFDVAGDSNAPPAPASSGR